MSVRGLGFHEHRDTAAAFEAGTARFFDHCKRWRQNLSKISLADNSCKSRPVSSTPTRESRGVLAGGSSVNIHQAVSVNGRLTDRTLGAKPYNNIGNLSLTVVYPARWFKHFFVLPRVLERYLEFFVSFRNFLYLSRKNFDPRIKFLLDTRLKFKYPRVEFWISSLIKIYYYDDIF